MHDEAYQFLARPLDLMDEVVRQPVHQFRMTWSFSSYPEVLDRAHESVAEEVRPYLIDCYPGGDGISKIDQPAGKVESIARAVHISWFKSMQYTDATCLDFMHGLLEFAAPEDVRLARTPLALGDDPHVGGGCLGSLFAKIFQLLAHLVHLGIDLGELVFQELALGVVARGSVDQQGFADVLGGDVRGLLARDRHDAKSTNDVLGAVEVSHLNTQISGFLCGKWLP